MTLHSFESNQTASHGTAYYNSHSTQVDVFSPGYHHPSSELRSSIWLGLWLIQLVWCLISTWNQLYNVHIKINPEDRRTKDNVMFGSLFLIWVLSRRIYLCSLSLHGSNASVFQKQATINFRILKMLNWSKLNNQANKQYPLVFQHSYWRRLYK